MARRLGRAGAVLLLLAAGAATSLAAARPAARTGTTITGTITTTGATTTTVGPATTTWSSAPAVLAFTGHGWGHGLGMAQWGAYGYALHGLSAARILAHYYPGTVLAKAKTRTVRVLLSQERRTTISSTGPFSVTDGAGTRIGLDPGRLVLKAALAIPDHPDLAPPYTFTAPEPLSVDGRAYRGKLVVSSDGRLLSTIDTVALEQYLKGVVPAEMPSTWPAAALEAQAVAARSYALANLAKAKPFDLYADVRSQAYGGVAAESDAASAAVDATARQVLLYHGKVADTLFHSSSGGRTVSAREATGLAVPYLVSVADPYDTLSPYHDWGPVLFDAARVAKTLKLAGSITALQVTDGPSGRVKQLQVTSADDSSATFTGMQLRTALGLRSTWFAPTLLRLQAGARTMTYGGAVTLLGSAEGAAGVTLESKPAGTSTWAAVGPLAPAGDGGFTQIVRPRVTTAYRLAVGDVRAGLARVAVAARVAADVSSSGIAGTASPPAQAPAELQVESSGGWSTISSTVTDGNGAFSFGGTLSAGTYRVRVAPGHGVVPGVSAPVSVP